MGCSKMPTVGYKGQRYEVRYTVLDSGEEKVFGWCNDPTGGALLESVNLWPSASGGRVVDLFPRCNAQFSSGTATHLTCELRTDHEGDHRYTAGK